MLSMNYAMVGQLIDNDVARLKRLGNRRAALLREVEKIGREITETSNHLTELHNSVYARGNTLATRGY